MQKEKKCIFVGLNEVSPTDHENFDHENFLHEFLLELKRKKVHAPKKNPLNWNKIKGSRSQAANRYVWLTFNLKQLNMDSFPQFHWQCIKLNDPKLQFLIESTRRIFDVGHTIP